MAQENQKKRPAAFLDRDGVLNVDHGYVCRREDFAWIDGAREAVRFLNDSGYLVIVVTNQSGVARGYYEERDIGILHDWMNAELAAEGARIDAFYYCPYHPEGAVARYRQVSPLRKPEPGMILQALEEWPIDPALSFLVGDKEADMVAASRAGIRGHLFAGGSLYDLVMRCVRETGVTLSGSGATAAVGQGGSVNA